MKIVKYVLGSRGVVVDRRVYEVLGFVEPYYLITDGGPVYYLHQSEIETGRTPTEYFYEKVEESQGNSTYDKFVETYTAALDSLEKLSKTSQKALEDIKIYEQKIAESKKSIDEANRLSIKCMKRLSEVAGLLIKEGNGIGKTDS